MNQKALATGRTIVLTIERVFKQLSVLIIFMFFLVQSSYALSLQNLFDGENILHDNIVFHSWKLLDIEGLSYSSTGIDDIQIAQSYETDIPSWLGDERANVGYGSMGGLRVSNGSLSLTWSYVVESLNGFRINSAQAFLNSFVLAPLETTGDASHSVSYLDLSTKLPIIPEQYAYATVENSKVDWVEPYTGYDNFGGNYTSMLVVNSLEINVYSGTIRPGYGETFLTNYTGSSPVPEPATMILLSSGLLCLVGFKRFLAARNHFFCRLKPSILMLKEKAS